MHQSANDTPGESQAAVQYYNKEDMTEYSKVVGVNKKTKKKASKKKKKKKKSAANGKNTSNAETSGVARFDIDATNTSVGIAQFQNSEEEDFDEENDEMVNRMSNRSYNHDEEEGNEEGVLLSQLNQPWQ